MKTFPLVCGTAACALLLGLATPAGAAEVSTPASQVQVNFSDPDNYSDFTLADSADPYRQTIFSAVRIFVTQQAEALLPAGYSLKVDFTDIDYGHKTPRQFAPAFDLNYQVMDASGAVVKKGRERLSQYVDFANYRYSVSTTDLTTEAIQSEKPMLKAWLVGDLSSLKR